MWEDKRVSVVFPAYNEAGHISTTVLDFFSTNYVDEVIVVDNNSTDGTAEEARKTPARVVAEPRKGYGYACQQALREASGELIILTEPDGTFLARDIVKLLAYANDFDMVLGTRTTSALIHKGANMGFFLKWGNWAVAKLLEFLFGGPSLTDVGCTMRLIRRQALTRIEPYFSVGGSHFSPEMTILSLLLWLKVIEVPVNYAKRSGVSKITGNPLRAIRVGFAMIWLIICYRLFWRIRLRRLVRRPQDASQPEHAIGELNLLSCQSQGGAEEGARTKA